MAPQGPMDSELHGTANGMDKPVTGMTTCGRGQPVADDEQLPPLAKGRWTSSHLVRWCAAQQNWDKIHYDADYARSSEGLPRVVINGALKQHLIAQFLQERFGGSGWVWRMDFRFVGPDLVNEHLEVRGRLRERKQVGDHIFCKVGVEIWNPDQQRVTTEGESVVVLSSTGQPVLSGLGLPRPADDAVRVSVDATPADGDVPVELADAIGRTVETARSLLPVDLGRLRLFADAIGELAAWHYDPESAQAGPYGQVVATPLYPIHGIELKPGSNPLSQETSAFGREGCSEVGRNISNLFDLPQRHLLNGGSKVEVHSLVAAGEQIDAESVLVSARCRKGRRSGNMLVFETLNRYETSTGRPLLTERQTGILR